MITRMFGTGDHLMLRYDRESPSRVEMLLPVTVVEDNPGYTMVYVAAGTPMKTLLLEDGSPVPRDIPYHELAEKTRILGNGTWSTNNALFIWKPGWHWDIRLYWNAATWEFNGWYVNAQDPMARSESGFSTTDHFLDVVIASDRSWHFKDADELIDAVGLGMYSPDQVASIKEAADSALELIRDWSWPFNSDLQAFRPDPAWSIPRFSSIIGDK